MNKVVVYFNQWFSSISNIIKDLKERNPEIYVIASSKNEDHAYKNVVDKFIVEDWTGNDSNYIDWLVATLKENKVSIFFAKKHSKAISANIDRLNELEVTTILEDMQTISLMDDKKEVYRILSKNSELSKYIPLYCTETGLDAVKQFALEQYKTNNPWCFKLNDDEGGASFRAVEQKEMDFNSLYKFRVNSLSKQEADKFISKLSTEQADKLIFMELLDSPEISIDCYDSKKGFIAICREKIGGTRVQKLYYNKQLSKICENIKDTFDLKYPFNVQFRVKHGKDSFDIENLRLLEINPRLSGGIYYSTFLGMNIADVCLKDILNKENEYNIENFINFDEYRVTHVEQAVRL